MTFNAKKPIKCRVFQLRAGDCFRMVGTHGDVAVYLMTDQSRAQAGDLRPLMDREHCCVEIPSGVLSYFKYSDEVEFVEITVTEA